MADGLEDTNVLPPLPRSRDAAAFGSPEWFAQEEKRQASQEAAKVYQLALWPDEQRALPTDFIACALFSAVQGKSAPYLRGEQIACINGYTVTFTGKRLTQVHADVLMGAAQLARGEQQGYVARFTSRSFLRLIGRDVGKSQRKSLQQLVDDLIATAVRVTEPTGKVSFSGSLLSRAMDVQEGNETVFAVEISRELCKAFTNGFAKVNAAQRRALMKQPLALWLQLYLSKFHKPVPVVELRRLSGSTTRRLTDFRKQLRLALNVLVEHGVIAAWHLASDTDVLYFAPPGKLLPGDRPTHAKAALALPAPSSAPQAVLELQTPPQPTPRAAKTFADLYPGKDFTQCQTDWQQWVLGKGIDVKKPDGLFLKFAETWAKSH
jgi:TrfA protein